MRSMPSDESEHLQHMQHGSIATATAPQSSRATGKEGRADVAYCSTAGTYENGKEKEQHNYGATHLMLPNLVRYS